MTGSSNQLMPASALASTKRSACLTEKAPLASTKSSRSPIARLAARIPAGVLLRIAADLHLDEAAAVALDPGRQLLLEPVVGVVREAAAAVDRNGVSAAAEERREGNAEKLGLEVPERGVERRDCAGGQAGAAKVSHGALQREPARGNVKRIAVLKGLSGQGFDQRNEAGVRVGVAEARRVAGPDVDHDKGRGVPGVGAVRFRSIGRNPVGRRPTIGNRNVPRRRHRSDSATRASPEAPRQAVDAPRHGSCVAPRGRP